MFTISCGQKALSRWTGLPSGPSQEAALQGTAFAVTAEATPSMLFSGLWDLAKLI